jgi:hypothetical protein
MIFNPTELLRRYRQMGIFLGWVAGLFLVGALGWIFTQPVRTRMLIRSVNRVLADSGEDLRLDAPISPWGMPGRAMQGGSWFTTLDGEDRGIVFPIMSGGIMVSFLGIISPEGTLRSLIPLSRHAEKMWDRLPPEYLRIYVNRIEASYALILAAEGGL